MLYSLRTTTGREDIVVDLISTRIRAEHINVKSVFHPGEIKGYIFLEGDLGAVQKAIAGMMHIKGLIDKPIKIDEVKHFLDYKKERIHVEIGDIIEIIGGPFKGEKGRVSRQSKTKDEITVELLEAATPIPVTIALEFVKVVKKATEGKKAEAVQ
ncbi:MAG: transcription elongation factor Spt5 [Candidatus Aenigmarchaeota archaeon]|nr:transcription elongation factor Spt5 [Candidatus Aenigmarchaeota archaeon]